MTALVPRQAAPVHVQPVKHKRDHNVVQFASDGVAADVRVLPLDRRNRSNLYVLRLAATHFDVRGRLIGVLPGGAAVDLGGLAVAPGSIGSARLAVSAPRTAEYEAVYLEIRAENVLLRVEAPRPPGRRGPRIPVAGAAGAALGACALCAGLFFAWPQPPMLALPERVSATGVAHIPYSAHGFGALEYVARYEDGAVLAGGPLHERSGTIALPLGPQSAPRRIALELALRNPLGARTTAGSFALDPAPAAVPQTGAPARIVAFAVRRDPGAGAETILASYLAAGERGTIVLIEPGGKTVAQAPFAHIGTSRLAIAAAYRSVPLLAKLTVLRGATAASAAVTVPAPALPALHADDAGAPPEAVTAIEAQPHGSGAGIVGIDGRAIAGKPLSVRMSEPLRSVHVELQDASGGTIAESDPAAGATRFTLPLPPSAGPQTYYLILRYSRNNGEETVVRTINAAVR